MSNRFRNTVAVLILCIIGYSYYSRENAPEIVVPSVLNDALNAAPAAAAKKPKKKRSNKAVSANVSSDLRDALANVPSTENPVLETAQNAAGDLSALGSFGDGFGDPPPPNPEKDDQTPPSSNLTISPSQPSQPEFPSEENFPQ